MKTFSDYLIEEPLLERILSIGINPDHEKFRDKYHDQIHDMVHKSYVKAGGYSGHASGSEEESKTIKSDIKSSLIKATVRNGKVTSVNMYKKQFGRKSIASATDGTDQGKADFLKNKLEDHEQKRAWGEVSGAPEHISKKIGVPVIPFEKMKKLTGKELEKVDGDTEHYRRKIGGEYHTKIGVGHPKE